MTDTEKTAKEDRQRMPNWTKFMSETIARLRAEKAVSGTERQSQSYTNGANTWVR